ncbi:battenin CLN3 protein [Scheffersomyces spartinae]|uniref:Protein BTN n=1 Tax=Scheffersomyces spartinae TaxID=45513 RepID=A0A9P8AH25_9ASCO|nr:battenin CLN3 protein [Scheffersomyces spartinae]KAG7192056.1 battenin CLN3 protein [Scheffersomyces spartinae]
MAVGGFSTGTGGAGLLGSGYFMLMTNILHIKVPVVLIISALMPWGFIAAYYKVLPDHGDNYVALNDEDENDGTSVEDLGLVEPPDTDVKWNSKQHLITTISRIRPLVVPYMTPLCLVYISEYVINQGISPTLLFPLDELPPWLFKSYRDIYVVYGFLYQLGVFISRSSVNFGIRIRHLYVMALLQFINVVITLTQSLYDFPFPRIWFLLVLILYEGLLGGLSYINTFMLVSEEVAPHQREFSMGCVTISDSLGVMVAGFINLGLETQLCNAQVNRGREWCRTG